MVVKIEDVKKFLLKKLSCKSNFEICDEFDIQPRSLFLLLTRLGIKEKSDKSFRSGFWHTTWDKKKVFLRSMLELNVAKKLDFENIEYLVESLRIPYVNSKGLKKIYIPDFYIPSKNLIIETKGRFYQNENCNLKARASRELGYNYIYILDGIEKSI